MRVLTTNKFCRSCMRTRSFVRLQPNYYAHLILTLLTVGFWLPFWGIIVLYNHYHLGWRCEECGQKLHRS